MVGYNFMLLFLVKYLRAPDSNWQEGLILSAIFCAVLVTSTIIRNYYLFLGYKMATDCRKILVGAVFSKIGRLSLKSLALTNSGKMITLISSDIFSIEK